MTADNFRCDAHFENGVATCSCSEAERFNSAPRDDECEWCKAALATRTWEVLPNGGTVQVCDECFEVAAAEEQRMLDRGTKF